VQAFEHMNNLDKAFIAMNGASKKIHELGDTHPIDWKIIQSDMHANKASIRRVFDTAGITAGSAELVGSIRDASPEQQMQFVEEYARKSNNESARTEYEKLYELAKNKQILNGAEAHAMSMQQAANHSLDYAKNANQKADALAVTFERNMTELNATGIITKRGERRSGDDSPNDQPSLLVESYNAKNGAFHTLVIDETHRAVTHSYAGRAADVPSTDVGKLAKLATGSLVTLPGSGVAVDAPAMNYLASPEAPIADAKAVTALVMKTDSARLGINPDSPVAPTPDLPNDVKLAARAASNNPLSGAVNVTADAIAQTAKLVTPLGIGLSQNSK
jgi:hypothetical protein